jgi:hypothetical protein
MNTDQDLKLLKHYFNRLTPIQKRYIRLLVTWRSMHISAWHIACLIVIAVFYLVTPVPRTYRRRINAHFIKSS